MSHAAPLTGTCLCGGAGWKLDGDPGPATSCNCSLCHRYGALWAYDHENERVRLTGTTSAYTRGGTTDRSLEIRFCPVCAAVVAWRGLRLDDDGRRRMAVNLRLAPLALVGHLAIDHFDGHDSFDDLPRDGRTVRDMWF